MSNSKKIDFAPMEGQTFIIGRQGHIYLNSPMVSKYHAELKVVNGRVHLRDLNSTNGTYLVKNEVLVHFTEGWVHEHQFVMIGDEARSVQSLLAIAIGFCDEDDTVSANHETVFQAAGQSTERRSSPRNRVFQ